MAQLNNTIALVTGASRGAGRGIALELGGAGATVYLTGRSVSGGPTTDDVPGTIDETAGEVTQRGGRGIAVRCDHTVDAEVAAVFARFATSTAYLGRAIVALASDPHVIDKSGQLVEVGALAREYGFTDVTGAQPAPFRIPASTQIFLCYCAFRC